VRYEASDHFFVAMPFTKDFDRAYQKVIKLAVEKCDNIWQKIAA